MGYMHRYPSGAVAEAPSTASSPQTIHSRKLWPNNSLSYDATMKLPPNRDIVSSLHLTARNLKCFLCFCNPPPELRLTGLSLRAARGSACTLNRGAELRDTVEETASSACRPRCLRPCLHSFSVKRGSVRVKFGSRALKCDI